MFPFWAKTLLLAGSLGVPTWLCAQLTVERTERLAIEQGLSDQEIRDIHCDARGFLWLATGLGLERYDGYHFEPYHDLPGSPSPMPGIARISESADACLYITYRKNLQFIDLIHTDKFDRTRIFLDSRTGLEGSVKALYTEDLGGFFVLSFFSGTLAIWGLHRNRRFEKICSLPWAPTEGETFKLLKSKTGNFWVHSSVQGLYQVSVDGKLLQHFENKDFIIFPDSIAGAVTKGRELEAAIFKEDGSGRFWLSFKNTLGVYLFQKGGNIPQNKQPWVDFSPQEAFTCLWEDQRGNLLFASPNPNDKYTFSRLRGLRANGEQYDGAPLLEVENKILDVFGQDFDRQIFFGTYTGMYKIFLKNQGIHQYLARQIKPGEFGAIARNIVSDGQGHVFFALEERRWYSLDTRTDQLDTIILKNAQGQPLELTCSGGGLAYDPAGYLWGMSCTDHGQKYYLHRYDLARKTTRTWPLEGHLITFYRQPDGRFCLLFRWEERGGYMGIFDPRTGKYTVYMNADGTDPFAVRQPSCVFPSQIHPGIYWIGTNDGVVAIDMQRRISQVYGAGERVDSLNFSNTEVMALYEDDIGALWLGTNGGGLNILSFEKQNSEVKLPRPLAVKVIDKSQGLSNNQVCGVLPDGRGGCIMSTNFGLNRYNPASQAVGSFYQHDGFTDNEFNHFSFFKDEHGRFYFGTINGLNAFYLPDLLGKKAVGTIQLTRLTKYFGTAGRLEEQVIGLNDLTELVVEPEVSYFQLDFMMTDYAQPEKNQFFAQLEGQEKAWSYLGNTHTLRYNRLPAGEYTFHLRGADAQGNWAETPLSLHIRSKEFFYRTWWFLSLVALALFGAGGAIAQRRGRNIRKAEKRQTALNARLAELEHRALQAQMNPHFIFNCLNSIQSFIAEGDKENAMRYVTRFAQLTRAVLHFSGKSTIGLDEEIAALDHYLDLECLRAGKHVQCQLEVAPDIDTFDTELPPMLVQPFVENSFKHGNISRLDVIFHKTDGQLLVTVQDDGIGLTGKTSKLHQSKGIAITRERLAFWNGRNDPNDLRITPLEKGLLVTMTIQLK